MVCLLVWANLEFSEGRRGMPGALASAHAWSIVGTQFKFKCVDMCTGMVREHAGPVSGQ